MDEYPHRQVKDIKVIYANYLFLVAKISNICDKKQQILGVNILIKK